jgi:hypothetical protein
MTDTIEQVGEIDPTKKPPPSLRVNQRPETRAKAPSVTSMASPTPQGLKYVPQAIAFTVSPAATGLAWVNADPDPPQKKRNHEHLRSGFLCACSYDIEIS